MRRRKIFFLFIKISRFSEFRPLSYAHRRRTKKFAKTLLSRETLQPRLKFTKTKNHRYRSSKKKKKNLNSHWSTFFEILPLLPFPFSSTFIFFLLFFLLLFLFLCGGRSNKDSDDLWHSLRYTQMTYRHVTPLHCHYGDTLLVSGHNTSRTQHRHDPR